MESARKKRKYEGSYQTSWKATFGGIITESKLGSNYAWCTVCCRDVKVAASGVYDVREHLKSKLHERQLKCVQMTSYVTPKCLDSGDATTRAEVMFCYFVAEHNLPALMADHFSDLAREMFPDSAIAKKFKCKRTKTTQIVKRCLAKAGTEPVIERWRKGPYSLMIDKSTDYKANKRLVILVRYFNDNTAQTRLLDMPVCSDGSAQGVFNIIDGVLR